MRQLHTHAGVGIKGMCDLQSILVIGLGHCRKLFRFTTPFLLNLSFSVHFSLQSAASVPEPRQGLGPAPHFKLGASHRAHASFRAHSLCRQAQQWSDHDQLLCSFVAHACICMHGVHAPAHVRAHNAKTMSSYICAPYTHTHAYTCILFFVACQRL